MAKHTLKYTAAELDEILASVGEKYGYINLRKNEAESMYYIECFASEDDFDEFNGDMEGNASLRLQNIQIPISTILGDSYSARLSTSIPVTAEIVSTKDTLMVPLRFSGVRNSGGEQENFGAKGSLTIRRKVGSGEWVTVLELSDVLTSFNTTETSAYDSIDILPALLKDVTQEIQVRASYNYEDTDGSVKTAYSGWVNIGKSITETTLQLSLRTDYSKPISLVNPNGEPQNFKVIYNTSGAVSKTLKFKIRGSEGEYARDTLVSANATTADACDLNLGAGSYDFLGTHGIKYAEAWLETSDGMGNTIKSNVVQSQLMVASDSTNTNPYLLLQNIIPSAINYMQATICDYAIYSPSDEKIKIAMLMTDYTSNYEEVRPVEYFRLEQEVTPNVKNTLVATIEIEAESQDDSYAYFRVRRFDGDIETDFIQESTGSTTSYIITVDNRNAFTPVAGATFLLNPKVRSNNESNPARIINSRDDNKEIESIWEGFGFITDGWVETGGQRVLRVPAGGRLTIKRNLWRQFKTYPDSTLNFEIDFAVHNVTNTTDPIINIAEDTTNGYQGVRMNATDGWIMTKSYNSAKDTLFSWQEGERTHLFFNIDNMVSPQGPDVTYSGDINSIIPIGGTTPISSIPLARVFMNGEIVREIPFDTTSAGAKSEWCENDCDIIIGNDGCDIDIYSIRAYESGSDEGKITTHTILMRNYISTLTSREEKQKLYERNSIVDGQGRVTLEAAKALGLNCMVWHGVLPSNTNSSKYKGWYEYFRYDENRQLMREYSGTNCKASGENPNITTADAPLTGQGQGSTAKTYWDWNIQDDNSKVETTISVAIGDFHESIHVSEPYTDEDGKQYVDIYGGNLGANFPVGNDTNPYEYNNGYVTVPDGWIDANGKYRGMGYMVSPDTALAQKKVLKINYASSMQSHLLGACKTYDLLHRAVCDDTPLQERVPTAVSAKHTEPFLLFHEENGNVYFKGMGNYGAGKMDNVAWGYNKDEHPNFALIEGSDNNFTLTDFRVPFDKNTAVYNCDEKFWEYNGLGNFDYDGGATVKLTAKKAGADCIEAQLVEGWRFKGETKDGAKAPTANIRDRWAFVCNYIYLHGTNIKAYTKGNYTAFINEFNTWDDSTKAEWRDSKVWFREPSGDYKAYHLYRFDTITQQWINAGLLGSNGQYKEINLATDPITANAYSSNLGDYGKMNDAFITAYAQHMHDTIKYVMDERSLFFNYCYVLMFLCGSDNSSKNTYYKIMPYAESEAFNDSFNTWYKTMWGTNVDFNFEEIYKVYLDGDDMDSIFRTDNNSHQTKPYYIERRYPCADEDPTKELYMGMKNQLFNYVEQWAKIDKKALPDMLNSILTEAEGLVNDNDLLYESPTYKKSAWGFLHKYFFNVQYYFPQVCYNEQARIRYEFPQMTGFVSTGDGSRSIKPITQSLGSQLQNELQYMKQRLVYMASFAQWAGVGGGDGVLGLTEPEPAMSFKGSGSTYKFTLKSHQYIYPAFNIGTSSLATNHRLKPGEAFEYTITPGSDIGDTGLGLCGIDYYTSVGNVGDFNVASDFTFIVQGKRLREFVAEPTNNNALFAPYAIDVKATQLDTFSLKGCNNFSNNLNLSSLIRCQSVDLRDTKSASVIIPTSAQLKTVYLGDSLESLILDGTPNLERLTFQGYDELKSLSIGNNVGTTFNTQGLITNLYYAKTTNATDNTKPLTTLQLDGIDWKDFEVSILNWMMGISDAERNVLKVTGRIAIKESSQTTSNINFDIKNRINAKFGNVDSDDFALRIIYNVIPLTGITLQGSFDFGPEYPKTEGEALFSVLPSSSNANNHTSIEYGVSFNGFADVSINEKTGMLTAKNLSQVEEFMTVYATAKTFNGEEHYNEKVNIPIWTREALVGDLVYFDGTYSSDAHQDDLKSVIGICFYVAPRYVDDVYEGSVKVHNKGDIVEEYHDPNDIQTRLMVATTDVSCKADNYSETYNKFSWGATTSSIYGVINGENTLLSNNQFTTSTFYDISDIYNIENYGASNTTLTIDMVRDEDNFLNAGFKPYSATTGLGDGFAYNERENSSMRQKTYRTLTAVLSQLVDSNLDGKMVNSAMAHTLKIIRHRNLILENGASAVSGDASVEVVPKLGKPTNLTHLAKSMDDFVASMDGSSKWRQIFYPAASAAYEYQPTVKTYETLNSRFTNHHWFLPTLGLLVRINWYVRHSTYSSFKKYVSWANTSYSTCEEQAQNNTFYYQVKHGIMGYIGYVGNSKGHENSVRPICAF